MYFHGIQFPEAWIVKWIVKFLGDPSTCWKKRSFGRNIKNAWKWGPNWTNEKIRTTYKEEVSQ